MADDDPNTIDFGDNSDPRAFNDPDGPAPWDADDPRRQKDQFAPPREPCECYCLHCNRVFMSDEIWFQKVVGDPSGFEGFWRCPTPNCGGAGFTFDIFPTDPNHPANAGWVDDDEAYGEEEFEPMLEEDSDAADWDPEEPQYKSAIEQDDDLEGEEWKYGLEPGERPPDPAQADAARAWEEEQKKFDAPDERPRELDWSDREDRQGPITEDDIPF